MLLMIALEALVSIMAAESYMMLTQILLSSTSVLIIVIQHFTLKVIPGHLIYIPLVMYDDYGEEINVTTFHAIIANVHKTASLDTSKVFNNNNHIRIYGEPGATGNIYSSIISSCGAFLSVHFTLTHCPPGYIWINESQVKCLCSAVFTDSYWGISRCNDSNLSGLLSPGF